MSDTELLSLKSSSEICPRESHSEVILSLQLHTLDLPIPPISNPVSAKDPFLFLLSALLTIMFPTHNQKWTVHLSGSRQQRIPQANFHSCFLLIFPSLMLLIVALCQPLLYANYNWKTLKITKYPLQNSCRISVLTRTYYLSDIEILGLLYNNTNSYYLADTTLGASYTVYLIECLWKLSGGC